MFGISFKWFLTNFVCIKLQSRNIHAVISFFFIEWRKKIENLNKAGTDSYMLKDC